nr:ATP synthase F0 subunit 8 [Nepiodes costipennis multicarinatus]
MPQMAPLNWLTLLLSFTTIFILFNTMNYFMFLYDIKKTKISKSKLITNWKW